jgi:hypothetical protein
MMAGKHYNPIVQKNWNKYKSVQFRVLESDLVDGDLRYAEQKWIDKYKDDGYRLCNAVPVVGPWTGCSEETKRKIGLASRQRTGWKHTEETRRRISESQKGRPNPRKGMPSSRRGVPMNSEAVDKSAKAKRTGPFNPRKHRPVTDEERKILRDYIASKEAETYTPGYLVSDQTRAKMSSAQISSNKMRSSSWD